MAEMLQTGCCLKYFTNFTILNFFMRDSFGRNKNVFVGGGIISKNLCAATVRVQMHLYYADKLNLDTHTRNEECCENIVI